MHRKNRQHAFTLLEILLVAALTIVLLALAIPMGSKAYQRSLAVKCLGNIRSYGAAAFAYYADYGEFPHWDGLGSADTKTGKSKWEEWLVPAYLPEIPVCPVKGEDGKKFFYTGNSGLCIYYNRLKGLPVPMSKVILAKEGGNKAEGFWSSTHFNITIWGNSGTPNKDEGKTATPHYHGGREQRGLAIFFLDGHSEMYAAPNSNWDEGNPSYGSVKKEGYIYHRDQLEKMSRGVWN